MMDTQQPTETKLPNVATVTAELNNLTYFLSRAFSVEFAMNSAFRFMLPVSTDQRISTAIQEVRNNIADHREETNEAGGYLCDAIRRYLTAYEAHQSEIEAFDFEAFARKKEASLRTTIKKEEQFAEMTASVNIDQWKTATVRLSELKEQQQYVGLYGVNLLLAIYNTLQDATNSLKHYFPDQFQVDQTMSIRKQQDSVSVKEFFQNNEEAAKERERIEALSEDEQWKEKENIFQRRVQEVFEHSKARIEKELTNSLYPKKIVDDELNKLRAAYDENYEKYERRRFPKLEHIRKVFDNINRGYKTYQTFDFRAQNDFGSYVTVMAQIKLMKWLEAWQATSTERQPEGKEKLSAPSVFMADEKKEILNTELKEAEYIHQETTLEQWNKILKGDNSEPILWTHAYQPNTVSTATIGFLFKELKEATFISEEAKDYFINNADRLFVKFENSTKKAVNVKSIRNALKSKNANKYHQEVKNIVNAMRTQKA